MYTYRVAALNAFVKSAYSNTAAAVVPAFPAAPGNVQRTATLLGANNARITLTWTDVTGETGYTVQRSTDPNFKTGVTTSTPAANTTSFNTGNVSRTTLWYLRIHAFSGAGITAWVTVSITTP